MNKYRMMGNDKEHFHYAEIEMSGSEDKGMVIPPRDPSRPAPVSVGRDAKQFIESLNISIGEQSFVKQARKWEDHVDRDANFVPFTAYWPTYESMSEAQRGWYFYWRNEVRYERYLRTDLSYIFLYVYELINGIGWKDPQDGYYMLMEVWGAYRSEFPRLDRYMGNWVADFVLVHQLDAAFADIAERVPHAISGDLFELELMHRFKADPVDLSIDTVDLLADYNVMGSKFYAQGGRADLEKYIPKVIALVDRYIVKKYDMRLVEMFHPGEVERRERYLFRGALYDASQFGRSVTIGVIALSHYAPLRAMITQLVRLTENTLRRLRGFKGQLRGIKVEDGINTLVVRYLERELGHGDDASEQAVPSVSIDAEKLAKLKRDSDRVRELLTVEEEMPVTDQVQERGRIRPGELEHVTVGGHEPKQPQGQDQSEDQGLVRELELDEGPELTQRDEMIQERQDETYTGEQAWNSEEMDAEWVELAEMLEPMHRRVLAALYEGAGSQRLMQLAAEYGSMPELIVEEINNAAMDTIGDLLIDGEAIADEYIPMIKHWMG
ncbi:TerB N-terminal domain-containing protein [Paenibacillus marinisediminis]